MEEIKKIIKDFIDSDVVVEVPDYALISLYGAMRSLFYKFDKMVTDIGFELLIPEEGEQRDIYKQRNALDDFCAALRRQIKFHQRNREVMEQMMFQTQHDPNFDDVDPEQKAQAMAMHHCGQDAEEPRHDYRAMVEGQGIYIHDGNVPLDQCGCIKIKRGQAKNNASCPVGDGNAAVEEITSSIKELEGMQVVHAFHAGHKCDGCEQYTSCNRNWKKVELVGGYFLCLAPLPNSIVTE